MPARTAKRTRAFEKKAPSTAQSGLQSEEALFLKVIEERASQRPLAFDTCWWPDYAAVAWILERDRAYTKAIARCEGKLLPPGIALADDTHEAWDQLRRTIADGADAEGMPFKRIGVVEANQPQRRISTDEVSSLKYHNDAEIGPCLVLSSWQGAAAERWDDLQGLKSIKVWRDAILAKFPEGVLTCNLIGPPINPNSAPYVPFFEAAYWIATEGGNLTINVCDKSVWKRSIDDELVPLIASGKTAAIGTPRAGGLPCPIPAYLFANILISYPYQRDFGDFVFGDMPYIECYGRVDEERWRKGPSDKFFSRWRVLEWDHLQVASNGLPQYWPNRLCSPASLEQSAVVTPRGRTPMYDPQEAEEFIFRELDRRGDFAEPGQEDEWNSQRHAEEALRDHFAALYRKRGIDNSPSTPTVRRLVTRALRKWRKVRSQADRR